MKISVAVAKRISQLLEKKKITKYRLCMDSGVSKSTLTCLMKGKYESVNLETLINIIRAIGITISDFFDCELFDEGSLICD